METLRDDCQRKIFDLTFEFERQLEVQKSASKLEFEELQEMHVKMTKHHREEITKTTFELDELKKTQESDLMQRGATKKAMQQQYDQALQLSLSNARAQFEKTQSELTMSLNASLKINQELQTTIKNLQETEKM